MQIFDPRRYTRRITITYRAVNRGSIIFSRCIVTKSKNKKRTYTSSIRILTPLRAQVYVKAIELARARQ